MDDVDKFSAFIGKVKVPSPTPTGTALRQSPSEITNFGSDEVDKFTRFTVAASFNDGGDTILLPLAPLEIMSTSTLSATQS